MYQMVFVVNDKYAQRIIGVYNEFPDALEAAKAYTRWSYSGYEISITPVTVDLDNQVNGSRTYCINEQEVVDAVQDELDVAYDDYLNNEEAEAEDEDEDEYEDEDESEDEDEDEDESEDEEEDDEEDEDEDEEEDETVDDIIDDAVETVRDVADEVADIMASVLERLRKRLGK